MREPDELGPARERLERRLGSRIVAAVPRGGGYTRVVSFRVGLGDGRTVFVKTGADAAAAASLRTEAVVLAALVGPFAPRVIAWEDDAALPLLILEDLGGAAWPPPYPENVTPLFEALAAIAAAPHPPGLPRLRDPALDRPTAWERIAANPEALLRIGVCSRTWLERALPALVAAERSVRFFGEDLCHGDVFAGNVCFVPDRGTVLVDWPTAAIGNHLVDVGFAALSVLVEGGRLPAALRIPGGASIAAFLAGHNAWEATQPLPAWARPGATLREDQLGDLRHALPWAAAELDLPPPDGDVRAYRGAPLGT